MAPDEVTLPIFPLDGVVLFPHTRQLLHIFEPRYRAMTQDAIAGDGTIGLVLPRQSEAEGEEPIPVYPIGCAGRITASRKLPDGRFLILLQGWNRFEILREEATPKPYRIAVARLLPEPEIEQLSPMDQQALHSARRELEIKLHEVTRTLDPENLTALQERMATLDPIQLTHALAFGLDCSPLEKQGLLEASGPLQRCRQLIDLLEFHRIESQLPEAPRTLN